jgi:hypothetical protein
MRDLARSANGYLCLLGMVSGCVTMKKKHGTVLYSTCDRQMDIKEAPRSLAKYIFVRYTFGACYMHSTNRVLN